MKKIMKQVVPALVHNVVAGGGGVASAASNKLKSKIDAIASAPSYVWPLIKMAVFTALPFGVKALAKGKSGKQIGEYSESFSHGANGVNAVELANSLLPESDKLTIDGIDTLGYPGNFNYGDNSSSGDRIKTLGSANGTYGDPNPFPFQG